MRSLLCCLLVAGAVAQSGPRVDTSQTTENLRGVSAVSRQVAWASGTHGTYLRTTDAGRTWASAEVPDAVNLDFRGVVAFSADEAFLLSAGPGDQSRIYHTADAGQHWQLQFKNDNPKGFFDSIAFWDSKHGIALGDPIPDESGKLHFELLLTDDGQTWHAIPPSQLPEAIAGEGAFAASNTCLAILRTQSVILSGAVAQAQREQLRSRRTPTLSSQPDVSVGFFLNSPTQDTLSKSGPSDPALSSPEGERETSEDRGAPVPSAPDPNIWFATGGKVARVFHSSDRGQTWQVFDTPILHGPDSAGIFSIAFRDPLHGVIAGGDYKHPKDDGPDLAFTADGGQTWNLSQLHPQAYFSAIAYDLRVNQAALHQQAEQKAAEQTGKKLRMQPTAPERLFIIGPDFIFDFRPPANPRRIGGKKKQALAFNAVSPYPEGGALVVGPKGSIAFIP
ncbi:MAG: hypothetical protein WCF26_23310 [Candidatus Sulfotelmatobacter sp.]